MGPATPERFAAAIRAIDAANADDPHSLEFEGRRHRKEQLHAELMTAWVQRLDPEASEAQLLAARAHHLRRWTLPREEYPEGRVGYRRWRAELRRRHAVEVARILRAQGYEDDVVDEVGRIVRKDGLGTDPAVQVHEDALCLVFLQTQLGEVAARLGSDKAVAVLRKTLPKMSEAGRDAALGLRLSDDERRLLEAATAPA